jgi:CRP-like cAMP-binding protein
MVEKAVETFMTDLMKRRKLTPSEKPDDKTNMLFQGLSENSLQMLLSQSYIKDFPADNIIVQQGDEPNALYYILEGKIKTQRFSTEGAEATIRMLSPGETFMDAVIFMGGKSPVGAQAVEKSKLLLIPADIVRKLTINDSQFSANLLQIVTRHYKTAVQQIDSITTKNPVSRLGYYFLRLHIENGSPSMGIDLPFRKSMIANHLGMTPETFSRALKQIKKTGIDVDQDKISFRDAYALCHYGTDSCLISPDQCPSSQDTGYKG